MKKSLLFVLAFIGFYSSLAAQTPLVNFTLRIDSLPSFYTSHVLEDSAGIWKPRYLSGFDSMTYSSEYHFYYIRSVGQIVIDSGYEFDDIASVPYSFVLTTQIDPKQKQLVNLDYEISPLSGIDHGDFFSFRLANVALSETDSTFQFLLNGVNIIGHNLFAREIGISHKNGDIRHYNDTITATGLTIPTSSIFFSISKQNVSSVTPAISETEKKLLLFPLPASKTLYVIKALDLSGESIKIYDCIGRVVKDLTISKGVSDFQIDISTFPSGIYWILVGDQVQKFTVEK